MASEIKVDTIVNAGGDNDAGIDLATNDNIKFNIAGSQKASIESDGDVFIGKTTGGTANVGVEMRGDGLLLSTRDGNVSTILRRNSDDGEVLRFQKDASSIGALTVGSGDLSIHSTASGHVGFRFGNGQVLPAGNDGAFTNDTMDLGGDGGRFDDVFATNGTINTSDQNEKQDIASLTAKELNVAKKLSTLFKTFKWKNRVAEKGDKARTHSGIIAQDIQSAFSEEGLDASNYGLFTIGTWWEKDKDIYNTEEEAPKDATKKTRLGVRYPELFSFIFSSIEARLTALESK